MDDQIAFKGFLDRADEGVPVRGLFITPNAPLRELQQIKMINAATARGMHPLMVRSERKLNVGPGVATLRIAHPFLDRELKGLQWHFVHGLEYLDVFEDGKAIAANLAMQARI